MAQTNLFNKITNLDKR